MRILKMNITFKTWLYLGLEYRERERHVPLWPTLTKITKIHRAIRYMCLPHFLDCFSHNIDLIREKRKQEAYMRKKERDRERDGL